MPRHSQSKHPVAVVRRYTGKTQLAFAQLVGVSHPLIRAIEAGARNLTADVADKIGRATGADRSSLLDLDIPHPLAIRRKTKYSTEAFDSWRSSFQNDFSGSSPEIIEYAEVLKEEIEILLFASLTRRHRSFRPVLSSLCESIGRINKKFGLAEAVKAVRKGNAGPSFREYEIRKEETFLYRLFGRTKFPGDRQLKNGNSGITFFKLKHSQALQASVARRHRALLQQEIRRLSRLTISAKAK